ncbi:CAP domain-containing protein [Cytobacillus praedii]|uniref:CAP domain-containing protein n=1 Tax=Cytobacillus praedii TaxID=1742358 RepID=UPI002E24558B|nr:CAP domain-containing protein [Cytobacillus praedii]
MRMKFAYALFIFFYFLFSTTVNAQSIYVVVEGDTLWKIAKIHQISLEQIIPSNRQLENPNLIFPGQVIAIPTAERNMGHNDRLNKEEEKLADLLNRKRSQFGMKPLMIDDALSKAAKLKSADMINNKYISHYSPIYGSPSSMLIKLNISYQIVNESIGAGHQSAELVISSWLHSNANRENLLNDRATKMGVGYVKGGQYGHYWTVLIVEY